MENFQIQLTGRAIRISQLSNEDVLEMYDLFQSYFDQTSLEIFSRDIANKNWVLTFREPNFNALKGFSTMAFYKSKLGDHEFGVVFSGDTIIDKQYWGTPELPKEWIKTVMKVGQDYPEPLYWFLISSGYKTYRFLAVFFKEFYPCYKTSTPQEAQRIMDHLAWERFGNEYDPSLGVVRFSEGATPLKAGVAGITPRRLKDNHVKHFLEKNPGHIDGDELVCLAVVHPDNFTPAGKRMLR